MTSDARQGRMRSIESVMARATERKPGDGRKIDVCLAKVTSERTRDICRIHDTRWLVVHWDKHAAMLLLQGTAADRGTGACYRPSCIFLAATKC